MTKLDDVELEITKALPGSVVIIKVTEPLTAFDFDTASRRIFDWCKTHGHVCLVLSDGFSVTINPAERKIHYLVTEDGTPVCGTCGQDGIWDDGGLWCYECSKYLIEHGDAAIGEASPSEAGR